MPIGKSASRWCLYCFILTDTKLRASVWYQNAEAHAANLRQTRCGFLDKGAIDLA
jgi:hypothetical protein